MFSGSGFRVIKVLCACSGCARCRMGNQERQISLVRGLDLRPLTLWDFLIHVLKEPKV